ncbi:MAG TPA: protein-L-isoaspartate O-methyltransferase [Nocardioidaceae bacterium]|nr:protein-L-isoaspartate O-methyltransferase [Nocardioidaceae bacterium]
MTDRDRLQQAFRAVRREDFLPPEQRPSADQDRAIQIGYSQTNSQPSTVFNMLELLEVEPGHRVLDVGCGSGWTTALLGVLVGEAGEVHGVELVPELVSWGRENLAGYDMSWTDIAQASSQGLGLPDRAPFDRILVSAEAASLPRQLVAQLAVGGVMVVPVAGRMTRVRRTDGGPEIEQHGHYAFVPLIEPD